MSTRRLPGSGRVLHFPGPTGYYFKTWPDPGNFSRNSQRGYLLCDRLWCTTLWHYAWPIFAHLCFAGESRWQCTAGRFNQLSDTAYSNVRIDRWSDYATRYIASLAASTAHWAGVTARCFVYSDFYCDVIIMFRIVHYNKDLYLKIRNEKIMQ